MHDFAPSDRQLHAHLFIMTNGGQAIYESIELAQLKQSDELEPLLKLMRMLDGVSSYTKWALALRAVELQSVELAFEVLTSILDRTMDS